MISNIIIDQLVSSAPQQDASSGRKDRQTKTDERTTGLSELDCIYNNVIGHCFVQLIQICIERATLLLLLLWVNPSVFCVIFCTFERVNCKFQQFFVIF